MGKICSTCRQELPLEDFPPNVKNKDGLNRKCRECFNAYMRAWYEKNKEKHLARVAQYKRDHRMDRIAQLRGITVEEVMSHLASPCDICGDVATEIDHDHRTDVVRGGLCHWCNTGLGFFKDEVSILVQAIEYLNTSGRIGTVL